MKTMSEDKVLVMKLPSEIEELIKEFAQPLYKHPSHFYAMNTLFSHHKRCIMKSVINTIYPEQDDPCVQTRFNRHFRRAQNNYRNQQIGEIYEELAIVTFGSTTVACELFKRNILSCSRNLTFDTDKEGKPIKCSMKPLNCSNVYSEIVIVIYFFYMVYVSFKSFDAMMIITNIHTIPFMAIIHFTPTTNIETIKITAFIILHNVIHIMLYWTYINMTHTPDYV